MRRIRTALPAALVLLVLQFGVLRAVPLRAGPPPQTAESDLLWEFISGPIGESEGDSERVYTDTIGLQVTDWLQVHEMGGKFYGQVVTSNLRAELTTTPLWMGLVEDLSGPAGAILSDESSDGSWYVQTTLGPDVASDAATVLQTGDRVWWMQRGGLLFLVRGEDAIPLGWASSMFTLTPTSLRDVQLWWLAEYGAAIPVPEPTGGGTYEPGEVAAGGGADGRPVVPQDSATTAAASHNKVSTAVIGLLATVLVASAVAWRRRGAL